MPVHSISWLRDNGNIVGIRICMASNNCQAFPFAGIVLPDGQEKADAIAAWIQGEYLDNKQRLNILPNDDPDRHADPNMLRLFWDGPGAPGQTDLVSRSVLVTVKWTGSTYVPTLDRIE